MPTPIKAYEEAAKIYGGLTHPDEASLIDFFKNRLPNLPQDTIDKIYDYLLCMEVENEDCINR